VVKVQRAPGEANHFNCFGSIIRVSGDEEILARGSKVEKAKANSVYFTREVVWCLASEVGLMVEKKHGLTFLFFFLRSFPFRFLSAPSLFCSACHPLLVIPCCKRGLRKRERWHQL
jgi:hypothetical protein